MSNSPAPATPEKLKISISYVGMIGWSSPDSESLLLVGFGFVYQDKKTMSLFHKGDLVRADIRQWRSKDGQKTYFYAEVSPSA